MNSRLLSIPERVFVEEARANTRDKVAYMKLSVLVMLDEGLTQEMTATLLGIGLGTVNKCKRKYEDDGLDKYLDKHYVPYTGKLTDEQLVMLEDQVSDGMYSTCTQIIDWLSKNPKIQIVHLPPYSPNLNLTERLWKFMRKKVINLHYYRKFDDFRRAILDFFQNIEQYKWDPESIVTPNFQRFSASPGIR